MTTDMFLGGLIILTMVVGIVIAMTSSRNQGEGRFDTAKPGRRDDSIRKTSSRS
jgi:hypothetical protein